MQDSKKRLCYNNIDDTYIDRYLQNIRSARTVECIKNRNLILNREKWTGTIFVLGSDTISGSIMKHDTFNHTSAIFKIIGMHYKHTKVMFRCIIRYPRLLFSVNIVIYRRTGMNLFVFFPVHHTQFYFKKSQNVKHPALCILFRKELHSLGSSIWVNLGPLGFVISDFKFLSPFSQNFSTLYGKSRLFTHIVRKSTILYPKWTLLKACCFDR